ncbi:ninein isoform X1 [Eublepharis macularius]|uniref:Ninein isoform X1 n=1 Tax=Eublepharis macularius TaxID=481883 RepID=A0AA97IWL3_EUBMA|nr:ninein isoform X1 [Eublepharis macularius]
MDEAEQDQHEARLKELFDSFDLTGSGSLGQEELTDLCHVLHLEEVAPGALQQALLQDNLLERVNFSQFKEALILILSRTLTNEEPFEEPDSSPEAQPKYIKGGKRYGRRSLPEFQEPVEEFAKVTVIEPLSEEARPPCLSSDACNEHWQSQDSEEYEAEGQLRFWNPDDLNASPNISPTQDWIEEKLREVCENLGISRDGHLDREKLVSICEQYGLQNIDTQVLEEVFRNLEHDGMMSIEDFFYGLFKIGKPLPPSASTPYRQLKRHLSMQSFDESGRRTTTTSAVTTTISFRVFSSLDDGMGYAAVDRILDIWHEEGIENSHEVMKGLDFSLDGKVNLTELTLALENELLVTKNGIYQAALASFKTEIRHLMERVDQIVREKEKLRVDLEKAEKFKSLMASEVDDHHAAIERRNEYNLRKLDEEYKDRVSVLRNELRKEREQILQQAGKQRVELEQEIEALKTEENYLRDRLNLTLKENSRLETELLEMGEKLARYESTTSKLQKNLENVLAEKFGDLDPGSAEFFLQEERLTQMKIEYERQCRELQDQIDELQSQLEAHRTPGKVAQPSLENSLYDELADGGVECNHELGSEDCNPLNMSIEAEMIIEQMKDQHHRDLCDLEQELENTMRHYEKQLEETKSSCEKEQENLQRKFHQEMKSRERQVDSLQARVADLQAELARFGQRAEPQRGVEQGDVEMGVEEKAGCKESQGGALQARLEETCENFHREREELIQAGVWMEEKMRSMAQTVQEEKAELEHGFCEQLQILVDKCALEKEQLRRDLAEKHQQELQEERIKMEREFNGRLCQTEEQFAIDRQALTSKYGEAVKSLEERYQQEWRELSELQGEEKSRWEFEKDEIIQESAEAQERWKETLEKEKALSSALAQEKELLEKNFKGHLNLLMLEKEQLQKDLWDVKKQEDELRNRLLQVQDSHEKELREREEEIAAAEGKWELASQQLERLGEEFLHEREELNCRLDHLERSKQEELSRASAEKRELRLEVSKLEGKVEELQREILRLSKFQSNIADPSQDAESGDGDSSGPGKAQESREVQVDFPNLRNVQDSAEEENAAEVSAISNVLSEPEEAIQSAGFNLLTPEILTESQLSSTTDEDSGEIKGANAMKEGDASGQPVVETEAATYRETTETSSDPKKAYEDIRAENETLRLQKRQLQERISLLEMECEQAAHDRQDMASQVQRELDEILQAIPRPKMLPFGDDGNAEKPHWAETVVTQKHPGCAAGNQRLFAEESEADPSIEEVSDYSWQFLKGHSEANQERELEMGSYASDGIQPTVLVLPEDLQVENQVLKAELMNLFERNNKLESYLPQLIGLQCRFEESSRDCLKREAEKQQLREKVRELEEARDQMAAENRELQSAKLRLHNRLEELMLSLKALKGRPGHCADSTKEAAAERRGLQELNWKLKERVAVLLKQKGTHAQEKDDLNTALRGLQSTCAEQLQQLECLRCEAESLREENAVLRNEIALLNEEGSLSSLRLRELCGSREELWQKVETVRKEKLAVQKLAENLKKQVSELKARNQQLEMENADLGQKNSPSQADAEELSQQLLRVLQQRERESEKCVPEEWRGKSSRLKEELENCKIQSSTLVSSLEVELSQLRAQVCGLEQENLFLKQELEKVQQLPRCPDLSDLQNEMSSLIVKNEKLMKEKEALSEELNRCIEKVARVPFLENLVASLKQEKASWEHQTQSLKTQIAASQDKMSRLKSDVRVTQQENEALKQEVMSLHKQLQTANDKNQVLELAVHSTGLQSQPKKLYWDELDQLVKQEQQLLRQENERLQREVQTAKVELSHSREKIRHLESTLFSLKHQKHQSQPGVAKAVEQEKLKRECERLQRELNSATRKVSQMNSLERERKTISLENEGLRKKQVKLEEQLMELLHSSSSVRLSQTPHPRELQQHQHQQQSCAAVVPLEQYQQLQHQLLQAERRYQRLQEELENRPLDTNMPQGGREQLLKTMEKRMVDVEQQLRLVKRLLQDKVNQLKEQLVKNTKADEMVKDLYVENAQLLKALEMTEQRQKTVEKKNYLLEEKIANLSRIVKSLTSPALGSAAQLGS